MPFVDQLKQLIELHRAAELAMKDLIIRLWPTEPIPSSYFGLVKRLVSACPRLDIIKRSVCIEGARMAFACTKVHWGKMDAEKLMTEGPPEGKEHHKPELYYESVLKGSYLAVEQCTKVISMNTIMLSFVMLNKVISIIYCLLFGIFSSCAAVFMY